MVSSDEEKILIKIYITYRDIKRGVSEWISKQMVDKKVAEKLRDIGTTGNGTYGRPRSAALKKMLIWLTIW